MVRRVVDGASATACMRPITVTVSSVLNEAKLLGGIKRHTVARGKFAGDLDCLR